MFHLFTHIHEIQGRWRCETANFAKMTTLGGPGNPRCGFPQHPPGIGSGHRVQCEALLGEPFLPWEPPGCCDVVRHTVDVRQLFELCPLAMLP